MASAGWPPRPDEPAPAHAATSAGEVDSGAIRDDAQAVKNMVLRQLTGAARTRAQLERSLSRKGVPDDMAAAVLDRFEEVGLVDDQAFAQMWVESRAGNLGRSRRALLAELAAKGVPLDTARAAVGSLDEESEDQAAQAFAERRFRTMGGLDRRVAEHRLFGALARRGFSHAVAARVARETASGNGQTR